MANRDDVWSHLLRFFVSQLEEHWDQITIGGKTFEEKYGISRETCREFSLGFAPREIILFDLLQHELSLTSEDFINNDGYGFIRLPRQNVFEGRIIFPYLQDGKPIYFSSRATDQTPEYSTDKKYFHMRTDAAKLTELPPYLQPGRGLTLLVEGPTHALRLRQEGFAAVAMGGARPNEGQLRILKNCPEVTWLPDVDILAAEPSGFVTRGDKREFSLGRSRAAKIASILEYARRLPNCRLAFYPDEFAAANPKGDATDWFLQNPDPSQFVESILSRARNLDDLEIAALDPAADSAEKARQIEDLLRRIAWRTPVETSEILSKIKSALRLPGEAVTHMKKQIKQLRSEGVEPPEEIADFSRGSDFRFFNPGQDYHEGTLYYTVCKQVPVTTYKDNKPVNTVITKDFVIGSDGSFFALDEHELCSRKFRLREGFRMAAHPSFWSDQPGQPFTLPSFLHDPAANSPDGVALLREIRDYFRRYIYFEHDEYYSFISLFVFITYCIQIFDTFGFLALHGTRETGKSRLMEVLESIVFNPMKASSQSDSYIFRSVDSLCPTLFIDEAENLSSLLKANESVNEKSLILQDAYRKGGGVGRCVGEENIPYKYFTYCPYIIANTRGIHATLQSRTFYFPMVRYPRDSKILQWRRILTDQTSRTIRAKLYCWTLSHAAQIADSYRRCLDGDLAAFCDTLGLRGRELEIWTPPLAMAALFDELAGQPWKYDPESSQPLPAAGTFLDDLLATQSKITALKMDIMLSEDATPTLLAALRQIITEKSLPGLSEENPDEQWYPVGELTKSLNQYLGLKYFPTERGANSPRHLFPRLRLCDSESDFARKRTAGRQKMCVRIKPERVHQACETYGVPLNAYVELATAARGGSDDNTRETEP